MVRPEKTDEFRTVEEAVARIAQVPEKDLEKAEAEASRTDPTDKTSDDASEDSEA